MVFVFDGIILLEQNECLNSVSEDAIVPQCKNVPSLRDTVPDSSLVIRLARLPNKTGFSFI